MDRDRLKQIRTTDITESRINEDFVEWLRTKFWTWLLLVLVGVAAWVAWIRWQEHRVAYVNEAWGELVQCSLISSFEEVAAEYADVPGLPLAARRLAAERLLRSIQTNRPLEADPLAADSSELTPEQRVDYLVRADRLYREILAADDGALGMTLHAVGALTGRAVLAESRGESQESRSLLEQAAQRAEEFYPELAQRLRARASAATEPLEVVTLPRQVDLPPPTPQGDGLTPVTIEEGLQPLLLPSATGGG
jgi:hypothetical protein